MVLAADRARRANFMRILFDMLALTGGMVFGLPPRTPPLFCALPIDRSAGYTARVAPAGLNPAVHGSAPRQDQEKP